MIDNRTKVVAVTAVILPVCLCIIAVLLDGLSSSNDIFLIINGVFEIIAVNNLLDIKEEKKDHNSPFIVAVMAIVLTVTLLFGTVFIISIVSGRPVIPGQR